MPNVAHFMQMDVFGELFAHQFTFLIRCFVISQSKTTVIPLITPHIHFVS